MDEIFSFRCCAGADAGAGRNAAAFVDRPWPGRYNKCVLTVREKDGERP
jgi:hypothetical protein